MAKMADNKRTDSGFIIPPDTDNHEGKPRRFGYELEYVGVDLRESVAMLEQLLDCQAEQENAFVYHLPTDQHGQFRIEIDASLLSEDSYKEYLGAIGMNTEYLPLERRQRRLFKALVNAARENKVK